MTERLMISFSGGETSAFMAQWLMKNAPHKEKVVVFANTGQEAEETLEFVERCDKHFGLNVVWIEAAIQAEKGMGTRHKVVDFDSAERNGELFHRYCEKYGLPGPAYPGCTTELKIRPIKSYMGSLGWRWGSYEEAIGIRVDEMDRMRQHPRRKLIYPLVKDCPMTKADINRFFRDQPFRLRLKGYQGNCKWCWKKTLRKHLTIATENPEWYDLPSELERRYEFVNVKDGGAPRRMFRKERTASDLIALAQGGFDKFPDDKFEFDAPNGDCSDSCEAF